MISKLVFDEKSDGKVRIPTLDSIGIKFECNQYMGHVKSLLTDPYIYLEVVMQKSPFHSKTPTSFNLKQMFDQINC